MPFSVKRIVKRREFLKMSASVIALAMLDPVKKAYAAGAATWKQQFDSALAKKPWLTAFMGTQQEYFSSVSPRIQGDIPKGLTGTLFRNGPARHEIDDYRFQHWFDGDGMIQSYNITESGVSHQARMIQTQKYRNEKEAQRALYRGFGSSPPNAKGPSSPDTVNTANISVLAHHDKLFALWEAGSPYEIDPVTLETRGIHSWSKETQALPFSAHPRIEPDGTLWNFGYAPSQDILLLWHIDAGGNLKNIKPLNVPKMTIPHDFVVTEKHIIVMLAPLYSENKQAETFLDAFKWHPEDATRVIVIDKNSLELRHTYELPAQWVFHFGNAWEDESGTIRFDGARSDNIDVMNIDFREVMRGISPSSATGARHYQYRIDTRRGTIVETPILDVGRGSEFPGIDPRVSTQKYEKVFVLSSDQNDPAPHGWQNAVSMINVDSGYEDRFVYDNNQLPEEHIFVPKMNSAKEGAGWVLGTFLDYKSRKTGLNIFNATNLADGPMTTVTLPYALPMGLHGKFLRS